jgi:hypothetical protein
MSQTPRTTRPNDDYDWDSDGQIKRGSIGTYILKGDCDAIVKKPSWFRTETVIRPYPAVENPADPNSGFEPYRFIDSTGRNRFSNWIRRYICAWGVGNPATTFLIKRPAGAVVFDPATTPLGVLFRSINNAVKRGQANPEWPPLVMANSGKSSMLTGPKECYLIQGALFRHDKKDFFGRFGDPLGWGKNPPLVLMISSGAGADLCERLNEERDGYRGDPNDFEARYVNGDPVGLENGRFIHFFEKGSNPYNRYQSQPQGNATDDGWSGGGGKRTKDIGFDIYFSKEFEGIKASLSKDGEQMVRQKWRPWDQILYFPTEIEQAHMLFRCFPLSACIYAFEGVNKDWIPEDAYRRFTQAVSVSVPGNFLPQRYGQSSPVYQQQSYAPAPGFAPGYGPMLQQPAQPQQQGWGMAPAQQPKQSSAYTSGFMTADPVQDSVVPTHEPVEDAETVSANFGFDSKTAEPANVNTVDAITRLAKARNALK